MQPSKSGQIYIVSSMLVLLGADEGASVVAAVVALVATVVSGAE